MRGNLTLAEIAQGKSGPQYSEVKPSQVFGPNADGQLAQRIRSSNCVRYWSLKEAWEYDGE
jgi:hypothetical protein